MSIKQGAFRLWIVATALWICHLCWAIDEGHTGRTWGDIVASSFADDCWTSEQTWFAPPPQLPDNSKPGDELTDEENLREGWL